MTQRFSPSDGASSVGGARSASPRVPLAGCDPRGNRDWGRARRGLRNHRAARAPESLYPAWQTLNDAKAICFLGFGFDLMNLDRLRFGPKHPTALYSDKEFFATTYGLKRGELMPAQRVPSHLKIQYLDMTIVDFLRHEPIVHE